MQKAADAFRTISEVADDLSLPQHVLRFWETRFPQIRPLKRAGGRRYYRPNDVTLLRTIRQLLYDEGYTIKGVQRLLKEQGSRGLGVGMRTTDYEDRGETPDVGAHETQDVSDIPLSIDRSELMPDPQPAGEDIVPLNGDNRGMIEDALSTIDECRHLLETALQKR